MDNDKSVTGAAESMEINLICNYLTITGIPAQVIVLTNSFHSFWFFLEMSLWQKWPIGKMLSVSLHLGTLAEPLVELPYVGAGVVGGMSVARDVNAAVS